MTIGILASWTPRNAPSAVTCNPSEIWKIAAINNRLAASLITAALVAAFSILSISKYNEGNQSRNKAKSPAKKTWVHNTNKNTEKATRRKLT